MGGKGKTKGSKDQPPITPKRCISTTFLFAFLISASTGKPAAGTAESLQIYNKKPMRFVFIESVFSFRGLICASPNHLDIALWGQLVFPADVGHLPLNRVPCNMLITEAPEHLPAVPQMLHDSPEEHWFFHPFPGETLMLLSRLCICFTTQGCGGSD